MKSFILKNAIFACLVGTFLTVVKLSVPYYWGNEGYVTKLFDLENRGNDFNTIFIGSSRTFRQVNPDLFDTLLQGRTKSYNLGTPATFVPETYFFLSKYLKNKSHSLKNIFIELQPVNVFPNENLSTKRAKYFLDYETYQFANSYFKNLSEPRSVEVEISLKNYKQSYLENLFSFGMIKDIFQFNLSPFIDKRILENGQNGYYPLDYQITSKQVEKSIIQRRKEFQEAPAVISERQKRIEKEFKDFKKMKTPSVHLSKLIQIIKEGEMAGINIIFILYPRMNPDAYATLLPILPLIPEKHIIDLANPEKYPEFYSIQNSFDIGHLNSKGAERLTRALSDSINLFQITID